MSFKSLATAFFIFPGHELQAVADQMHNTELNLGVRVGLLNGEEPSAAGIIWSSFAVQFGDNGMIPPAEGSFRESP